MVLSVSWLQKEHDGFMNMIFSGAALDLSSQQQQISSLFVQSYARDGNKCIVSTHTHTHTRAHTHTRTVVDSEKSSPVVL